MLANMLAYTLADMLAYMPVAYMVSYMLANHICTVHGTDVPFMEVPYSKIKSKVCYEHRYILGGGAVSLEVLRETMSPCWKLVWHVEASRKSFGKVCAVMRQKMV